ncbi:DedA family protein [Candidatus Halobonum tyrrellensis]|uniref:VTT domain-containing protein n=1 Tax=Candidatus Halobonum tyrrellensis G22 TaxID=1324957 RepID=V4IZF0_9EURY|nr:VTT domain-containing protein [Candidatus Halobonum tyrrellensis]ESP88502.1 hypothetical protein K933_08582 [Candidatus Halobonum tyrrellensis G22]
MATLLLGEGVVGPLLVGGNLLGSGLVATAQTLLVQYGYLAVCCFTFLESSLLFPLLPSEVVLPFAAVLLVGDPISLALFVVATTAGVVVGSVVAYYVFGRGGEEVVERCGPLVRVSDRERRWAKATFRRYGEWSVFWGRLLPFLRSVVSIPAGFAGMGLARFTAYSAGGGLLFNLAVGALAFGGDGERSVYDVAFEVTRDLVAERPLLSAVAAVAALAAAAAAYERVD